MKNVMDRVEAASRSNRMAMEVMDAVMGKKLKMVERARFILYGPLGRKWWVPRECGWMPRKCLVGWTSGLAIAVANAGAAFVPEELGAGGKNRNENASWR